MNDKYLFCLIVLHIFPFYTVLWNYSTAHHKYRLKAILSKSNYDDKLITSTTTSLNLCGNDSLIHSAINYENKI